MTPQMGHCSRLLIIYLQAKIWISRTFHWYSNTWNRLKVVEPSILEVLTSACWCVQGYWFTVCISPYKQKQADDFLQVTFILSASIWYFAVLCTFADRESYICMLHKSHELYLILIQCRTWTNVVSAPCNLPFLWPCLYSCDPAKASWLSYYIRMRF